ncbi:methylisocitrate lyase [Evansella halocellulosilytica]|uniref:methylisocitrate lyase n=1 Tax=Evansella halocellulosilytica TaxID=2011013 RepID=UPI000BB79CE9|nr:methylisocitrate lyase [Evansella halocellulosilytica]
MSWLISNRKRNENPFNGPEEKITIIPGAHDAITALIAQKVGFNTLYISGAAVSASYGLPDLGVMTVNELSQRTKEIYRATKATLLVDIDTGYGNVINAVRTAKELEESGAAALQIEDQVMPKKCGHLNGKKLVPPNEMMQKIIAIKKHCPNLKVIARTDAAGVTGLEDAIDRANKYAEAGADVIFPEALKTEEEFKEASMKIHAPVLANMTEFGKTPYYTAEQFEDWGYDFVIFPVSSLRIANKAVEAFYEKLLEGGTQKPVLSNMQSREELYELIGYFDYETLDESIAKTKL